MFRPAVERGAIIASRRVSSDAPPDNISRYPVPYKKDLPYDIVALMEEVETKVPSSQWTDPTHSEIGITTQHVP